MYNVCKKDVGYVEVEFRKVETHMCKKMDTAGKKKSLKVKCNQQ